MLEKINKLLLIISIWFVALNSSSLLFVNSKECTNISDLEKFDCYPENGADEKSCTKRGCCWQPRHESHRSSHFNFPPLDVPWCYYPKNYGGYEYINLTRTEQGDLAFMNRTFSSPYPNDVKNLRIDVEYQTDNRLRIKVCYFEI